jgi:hypothetical protein
MLRISMSLLLALAVAQGTHAQDAQQTPDGVTESNDPAKAAAIEQAARELKERAKAHPESSADIVRSQTDAGHAFMSGGITVEDRQAMYAERDPYSLWVATVAKPSGAYLSDAKLRIVNVGDKSVALERTMDGPWLFIALPAGTYEVTATFRADDADKDQTLSNRVSVAKSGQRQVVLRFASSAIVAPEMAGPFKGNPFGGPPRK